VLQSDETIERDFAALGLPDEISLYHSRIPSAPEVTRETLAEMEAELPRAASLFPEAVSLDAVGYACTSGATVLGEAAVERLVRGARPETAVTNPLSALKAACAALGLRRLGLVTPYEPPVSRAICDALSQSGIEVAGFGSFGITNESTVAAIEPESVVQAMLAVAESAPCDAVFASCTNLRALEAVEAVERRLGKPALCSNQVLAWHMLRLAGLQDSPSGAGRLFRLA
jgi:maleate isomerase